VKSAAAEVLFAELGVEIIFAACFGLTADFGLAAGTGSLWKPTLTTGFAAGLVTVFTGSFDTCLGRALDGALIGVFTGTLIIVDLAGVTDTADAQIVTLPPFT
jgi:hypothetical protein